MADLGRGMRSVENKNIYSEVRISAVARVRIESVSTARARRSELVEARQVRRFTYLSKAVVRWPIFLVGTCCLLHRAPRHASDGQSFQDGVQSLFEGRCICHEHITYLMTGSSALPAWILRC